MVSHHLFDAGDNRCGLLATEIIGLLLQVRDPLLNLG